MYIRNLEDRVIIYNIPQLIQIWFSVLWNILWKKLSICSPKVFMKKIHSKLTGANGIMPAIFSEQKKITRAYRILTEISMQSCLGIITALQWWQVVPQPYSSSLG